MLHKLLVLSPLLEQIYGLLEDGRTLFELDAYAGVLTCAHEHIICFNFVTTDLSIGSINEGKT